MSLLGKKKVINPTLFNDRLASIKDVFKAAHENAKALYKANYQKFVEEGDKDTGEKHHISTYLQWSKICS